MQFVISCLHSNQVFIYDEDVSSFIRKRDLKLRNAYDFLHSIRPYKDGYVLSSTYGIHFLDKELQKPLQSYSHADLSNVHSVDYIADGIFVISNTGMDELLFVRLPQNGNEELEIIHRFDTAAVFGLSKKLPYKDRRNEARVSASDDHTHINCAHIQKRHVKNSNIKNSNIYTAYCALFHMGMILKVQLHIEKFIENNKETMSIECNILDRIENTGIMIHSSIPQEDTLTICSSAESLIHVYEKTTKTRIRSISVPFNAWCRSARIYDKDIVFTAERDREHISTSKGYAARMNMDSNELIWFIELSEEGPFDIEPAIPITP